LERGTHAHTRRTLIHTGIGTHTYANTRPPTHKHSLTHIQHTAHTNTYAHTDLELLEADDESDDEIGALLRPGKHNLTRAVLPIVSWAKDKFAGMVQTHAHICAYTCKALAQTGRESERESRSISFRERERERERERKKEGERESEREKERERERDRTTYGGCVVAELELVHKGKEAPASNQ
jgi:hypothetical protein